ncbi:unnamed protein product [Caenorhabditis brenneri]
MSAASFSLESLQFLLQHMDANRRFEIYNRCPSLREIEKSVPLKINSLVLNGRSVIVNDTTYKLGIIRKYNVGETPQYVTDSNEIGGLTHEVDRYGIEDVSDKYTIICPLGVIRLPFGVKFRVEQLMFLGRVRTTLEALVPVLHESSYPLKKLAIGILPMQEVNNPIVRTAGILRIRSSDISQDLSSITNPILYITMSGGPTRTILEQLMANCVEPRRPFGTASIFHFHWEPYFENEMEDILKNLNGVPIDDENVIIPVNDATQVKVSYGPFPEFAPRSKWAVKFSTEATEHL